MGDRKRDSECQLPLPKDISILSRQLRRSQQVYVFVLSGRSFKVFDCRSDGNGKTWSRTLVQCNSFPTNDYLVSSRNVSFLLLKDSAIETVAKIQAKVDAQLFKEKIAPVLDIRTRFVGEEPYSKVTDTYNHAMQGNVWRLIRIGYFT